MKTAAVQTGLTISWPMSVMSSGVIPLSSENRALEGIGVFRVDETVNAWSIQGSAFPEQRDCTIMRVVEEAVFGQRVARHHLLTIINVLLSNNVCPRNTTR